MRHSYDEKKTIVSTLGEVSYFYPNYLKLDRADVIQRMNNTWLEWAAQTGEGIPVEGSSVHGCVGVSWTVTNPLPYLHTLTAQTLTAQTVRNISALNPPWHWLCPDLMGWSTGTLPSACESGFYSCLLSQFDNRCPPHTCIYKRDVVILMCGSRDFPDKFQIFSSNN